ncbi:MAG TPA: type II CAAX endopeptidase family protein [Lentimicrobium sp.]|nr:type II CAAX endopeptidase family protein [Lentimicrobium sp.]
MRFITPFPNISEGMRIMLLLALIIVGAFVSIGLAFGFYAVFNGPSVFQLPSLMNDINFIRVMQIFNQLGMFIVPAFLIAYLTSSKPVKYLSFQASLPVNYLLTFILIIFISPFISSLMELNETMKLPESLKHLEQWMQGMEESSNKLVERMLAYTDVWSVTINIIMIVILPAVGEELLFRSILIKSFSKIFKNAHLAVWFAAILFSAFHMQFYGFLPRLVLGLMFGYIFIYSGSIWVPILAHFINNGTVVVLTYLNNSGVIHQAPDDVGKVNSIWMIIASAVISLFLIWYMARINKLRPSEIS